MPTQIKTFLVFLNSLLNSLLECWPLLVAYGSAAFVLSSTTAGRETIFASGSSFVGVMGIQLTICFGAVMASLFAIFLLQDNSGNDQPVGAGDVQKGYSRARKFARFHTSAVVAILFLAVLTFLLQRAETNGNADPFTGRLMSLILYPVLFLAVNQCRHIKLMDSFSEIAGSRSTPGGGGGIFLICLGLIVLTAICFPWAWLNLLVLYACIAYVDLKHYDESSKTNPRDRVVITAVLYIVVFLIFGGLLMFRPGFSTWATAANSFLLALNFWIAIALTVVMVWTSLRPAGYRIGGARQTFHGAAALAMIVVAAFLYSGPYNQKKIRTLEVVKTPVVHIDSHANGWLMARKEKVEQLKKAGKKYPVFIVCAEGGGIRAAFWSSSVLCALQDQTDNQFAIHVFGISAVSGGSVGAAVFDGLVKEHFANNLPPGDGARVAWARNEDGTVPTRLESFSTEILSRDFLASSIAAMLTTDLIHNLVPLTGLEDRSEAMERSFETAWRETINTDVFSERFDGAWTDGKYEVPSLFFNCTDARTGEPLVISNLSLAGTALASADVQRMLGSRSIGLSTAALLSARFPGIAAEGILEFESLDGLADDDSEGQTARLVDGGYFDNSGAATGLELINVLERSAASIELSDSSSMRDHIDIVAVMFTYRGKESKLAPKSPNLFDSMLGPVGTLDRIRQKHSTAYFRELQNKINADRSFILIELSETTQTLPLTWTLSRATCKDILSKVRSKPYADIVARLSEVSAGN